jgi:peptidoglycan hydrolase-like protein with peptidoglycan-binding domain
LQRDGVAERFFSGRAAWRDDTETVELRFGNLEAAGLTVLVRLPDRPQIALETPRAALGDLASDDILLRIRATFDPLAGGWRGWSGEVPERVLVPDVLRHVRPVAGRQRDVRLVFESRDTAATPWELTRAWDGAPLAQAPGIATVYRSLRRYRREEAMSHAAQTALLALGHYEGVPDGYTGDVTLEAVRRFQQRAGIEADGIPGRDTFAALRRALADARKPRPLRVVVLRPDPARQLERQRGETAAGSGLVGGYLTHGAEVTVVDDPTPDRLRALGLAGHTDTRPDIVHVAAPVRFGGGASVLDFGGDAAARYTGHSTRRPDAELTVSSLCELVQRLVPTGGRLPLLVLDVPLPGTVAEAVRALSARNSLAFQLMELGGIQALLATGLAGAEDQIQIVGTIAGGLAGGRDVADVARSLHHARPGADDLESTLAFGATALCLERPSFALFPLWAS